MRADAARGDGLAVLLAHPAAPALRKLVPRPWPCFRLPASGRVSAREC